jgi:hypothetical protein
MFWGRADCSGHGYGRPVHKYGHASRAEHQPRRGDLSQPWATPRASAGSMRMRALKGRTSLPCRVLGTFWWSKHLGSGQIRKALDAPLQGSWSQSAVLTPRPLAWANDRSALRAFRGRIYELLALRYGNHARGLLTS